MCESGGNRSALLLEMEEIEPGKRGGCSRRGGHAQTERQDRQFAINCNNAAYAPKLSCGEGTWVDSRSRSRRCRLNIIASQLSRAELGCLASDNRELSEVRAMTWPRCIGESFESPQTEQIATANTEGVGQELPRRLRLLRAEPFW
jgi:hypothetical protein